jgi:LysR family hydrogen peroxide-inducible transcriptional activator
MTATLSGLSLRALEYAAAVNQTRNFGRAADLCGVSQAGLSEQLTKLEHMLGTRLFERGHRKVEPTPAGAVLLEQIGRVLAEAHSLLDLSRDSAERFTGIWRLGAIPTLGPYYLPHVLRITREALPRLTWRLTEDQTDPLIDALRRGEQDLALIALPVPAQGLAYEKLFFEPFRLVCPLDHTLAGSTRLELDDLAGDGLILLEHGHCLRDHAIALCTHAGRHARHATSIETLRHMIAAGEGYSLLPALSLRTADGLDDFVVTRPIEGSDAGRTIVLAWRDGHSRDDEFRELARHLRDHRPALVDAG